MTEKIPKTKLVWVKLLSDQTHNKHHIPFFHLCFHLLYNNSLLYCSFVTENFKIKIHNKNKVISL